jgi:proteic killer suppression protein
MIDSFADEETQRIFEGRTSRKLPITMQKAARRKLLYLEEAEGLQDLRSPPGNRLELLRGDRAGQYSIRINEQWRICFYWEAGKAKQVKIEDYHD